MHSSIVIWLCSLLLLLARQRLVSAQDSSGIQIVTSKLDGIVQLADPKNNAQPMFFPHGLLNATCTA